MNQNVTSHVVGLLTGAPVSVASAAVVASARVGLKPGFNSRTTLPGFNSRTTLPGFNSRTTLPGFNSRV